MVASANWVPMGWGGRGLVPPSALEDDQEMTGVNDETAMMMQLSADVHQPQPSSRELLHIGIVDSDEEMEPFDAERFVDRLVEDDPPPWRYGGGGGIAGVTGGAHLWEAPEAAGCTPSTGTNGVYNQSAGGACTTAAKLYLQPITQPWPDGTVAAAPTHGGDGGQGTRDRPIVIPHDPILDALFTPARASSPEIVPTFALGLVKVPVPGPAPGHGGKRRGVCVKGFEPAAIYNIPPPPAVLLPTVARVPMAPVRPRYGGFDIAASSSANYHPTVESAGTAAAAAAAVATAGNVGTCRENSNKVLDSAALPPAGVSSEPAAAATAPLTGADSYSEEYDDERHAFLRLQELAHFVGPAYLAGPGKPGLVTPCERTALVDGMSRLHAAAPAACGGGPPLSLETLFLGVNLMDRFLSTAEGARVAFTGGEEMRLAASASLALASKYEDTQPASLWGVTVAGSSSAGVGGGGGDGGIAGEGGGGSEDVHAARKKVAAMEMRVASALGFRLTVPTALSFLEVFMRRASLLGYLPMPAVSERVRDEAHQILLCVLRDTSSLEHPPSALAAAALYWASCVTAPGAAAPASFAIFAVTGYQLEQLCRCLRDMEAVRTGGGGGRHGIGGGWAGAALPEHAGRSLFGAGGGHPAIAAL